jgi:hypothetical protein
MSWLTGFGQKYESPESSLEEEKSDITEEFDELIDKYTEIIEKKAHEKSDVHSHFTIQLPLFEMFLFNSKSDSSKAFCRMRMHEILFQHSYSDANKSKYLVSVDDIELLNEN